MASTEHREVLYVKPTVAVLYGDAASAALVHALKAWRAEYAPGHGYEGLIGGPIRVVQTKVRLLPNGRATILVECEGRRYGTNDAYYYDASLVAGQLRLQNITDEDPKQI
jgi:hypothetical protein